METYRFIAIHRPESQFHRPLQVIWADIKANHWIKYIAKLQPHVYLIRTDIPIDRLRKIPGVFDAGNMSL